MGQDGPETAEDARHFDELFAKAEARHSRAESILQQYDELVARAQERRRKAEYDALRLRIRVGIVGLLMSLSVFAMYLVFALYLGYGRVNLAMFIALGRDFAREFSQNPAFRLVLVLVTYLICFGVYVIGLKRSIRQLRQLSARDEADRRP